MIAFKNVFLKDYTVEEGPVTRQGSGGGPRREDEVEPTPLLS